MSSYKSNANIFLGIVVILNLYLLIKLISYCNETIGNDKTSLNVLFYYPILMMGNLLITSLCYRMRQQLLGDYIFSICIVLAVLFIPIMIYISR